MPPWEYQTIRIGLDENKKQYVVFTRDDGPEGTVAAILSHYGREGWELVTVMADVLSIDVSTGTGPRHRVTAGGIREDAFRAFFKRPVDA
jgi:hypothetical protein